MTTIFSLDNSSLPADVVEYLEECRSIFVGWHSRDEDHTPWSEEKDRASKATAHAYDEAIYGLSMRLRSHTLHGYHCTRLTNREMAAIIENGMALPCPELLELRINALVEEGLISPRDAHEFLATNQSEDQYRRDRIWFCFFEPKHAGESGIEDFLRHWGGEALYRSHQNDPRLGTLLRTLGTPCLIEADIPISALSNVDGLSLRVAEAFANQILTKDDPGFFEGCAIRPLEASCIRRILKFPAPTFVTLTACDEWRESLT